MTQVSGTQNYVPDVSFSGTQSCARLKASRRAASEKAFVDAPHEEGDEALAGTTQPERVAIPVDYRVEPGIRRAQRPGGRRLLRSGSAGNEVSILHDDADGGQGRLTAGTRRRGRSEHTTSRCVGGDLDQ